MRGDHYTQGRVCTDCPKPIVNNCATGRCRRCWLRWFNAQPDRGQKISERMKRLFRENPEALEKRRKIINHIRDTAMADPVIYAKMQAHGRKMVANLNTPEAITKRAAAVKAMGWKISEHRLAWCPPEYRDLHRNNVKNRHMKAAESRAMIEKIIAEKRRNRTFAETLALVSEGKLNIYTMPDLRGPDPSVTLGGVSAEWMG